MLALVFGPPLGHDEAAYAVAARGGGSAWLYRSDGTIALARLGLALGGAEWALRLANVVLGATVVLATWAVARAAAGPRAAAWSAAVIASAHPMTLHSAELMGDLPSTACVLAGIAVLINELDRDDGPRWRIVLAAPAFAAAFYLRYGDAPVIALAGVVAAIVWWRAIVRRPLPVIAAAAAFAALLAPHLAASLAETGSLLGILRESAEVPRRAYFAEGLVGYVRWIPLFWYGALVTPFAVIGLCAPVRRRSAVYLAIVGGGEILALGLDSHARPRYIFVALALLVVGGVARLLAAIEAHRRFAVVIVALAWLGAAIAVVPLQIHLARSRTPLTAAVSTIRADSHGQPCIVVARVVTQLMWYTGCDGQLVRDPQTLPALPAGRAAYVVSLPKAEVEIDPVATVLHATPAALPASDDAHVWRLVLP